MFSATKVRARITDTDPVFKVRYIGCIETFTASGTGCTINPVQKLWDNAGSEKDLKRVTIVINTDGIIMKNADKKKDQGKLYDIENISFCNADTSINEKIFCWICKDDETPRLFCHAVVCSNKEKAKSMALVCSRAFQIAYKEWKTSKSRELRESRKGKTPDQILERARSGSVTKNQTDTDSAESELGSSRDSFSNETTSKNMYSRKDSYCQTSEDHVIHEMSNNYGLNGTVVEAIAEVTNSSSAPTTTSDVGVQGDLDLKTQELDFKLINRSDTN